MEKGGSRLLGFIRKINDVSVVLLFIAMTITVLIQVFFRYVMQSPLRWTEEASRYLMIWLVLLGSGIAMRNKAHLQVDVLTSALPQKPKMFFNVIVSILTITFLLIMTYFGFKVAMKTMLQTSPAMQLPMALIYAAFPAGGVLMILEAGISFAQMFKTKVSG